MTGVTVRVLGIDPGSSRTGYGVLEQGGEQPRLLASGVIGSGRQGLPQRLARIFQGVQEVIGKYQPQVLALEEVFHAKNAKSALVLGQARGVVLLAAGLAGVEVCEYAPRRIKQTVAGSGGADKRQVQRMLEAWLGRAPQQLDASDAVAVALCHLHWAGRLEVVAT